MNNYKILFMVRYGLLIKLKSKIYFNNKNYYRSTISQSVKHT